MRTDCKIDKRQIPCPNARNTGFGLSVANVGNLIVYREDHIDATNKTYRTARVLGRVSAPKIAPGDAEVKGWALCMVLSEDCTFVFERWVDPSWIVSIRDVPHAMLMFFARPELPEADVIRHKMEAGYLVNHYLDKSGL